MAIILFSVTSDLARQQDKKINKNIEKDIKWLAHVRHPLHTQPQTLQMGHVKQSELLEFQSQRITIFIDYSLPFAQLQKIPLPRDLISSRTITKKY